MIPRLNVFVRNMRKRGAPVVYVKTIYSEGAKDAGLYVKARQFLVKNGLRKGQWGSEIVDQFKPEKGDYVIEKARFSAFYNTKMEIVLRSLHRQTLFFTFLRGRNKRLRRVKYSRCILLRLSASSGR